MRSLVEVLPDGPGHADDRARPAAGRATCGPGGRGPRLDVRRPRRSGTGQLALAERHHRTEPARPPRTTNVVAVDALPVDGDEQPAGLDLRASRSGDGTVDDRRRVAGVQRPPTACGDLGQRSSGSSRATADRRSDPRRTSRSSKGRTTPAISWPCLVALAGDDDRVPGHGARDGRRDGLRRGRARPRVAARSAADRCYAPPAWPRGSRGVLRPRVVAR